MAYNINNDYDVVDTVMNQVYLDNKYLKETWGINYVKNQITKNSRLDKKGRFSKRFSLRYKHFGYKRVILAYYSYGRHKWNGQNLASIFA